MHQNSYRPDIDGLRAIAVLSVLFFHVDFPLFEGGYVGVDVFFVISGFLITQMIYQEVINTGQFNWVNFYSRRARRLLPALVFTLLLSLFLSFLLFSPQHANSLCVSAIFATLSLSNIYFWSKSNYFDQEALTKPLLHTWSLSVEEQFYVIWPILLVFLVLKTRHPLRWILGLCGMSLAINPLFAMGVPDFLATILPNTEGSATIFYLTPFRIFELAIGATIVFMLPLKVFKRTGLDILTIFGLLMICVAILLFDDRTVFPSFNALLPCVGTAIIIYAGSDSRMGKLLGHPLLVKTGLMSYSLYLLHWPLIVFYRYYTYGSLSIFEQVCLCLLALSLSWGMYHYIEKPFRYRQGYTVVLSGFGLMGVVLLIAMSGFFTDGWNFRIPERRTGLSQEYHRSLETKLCESHVAKEKFITCSVQRHNSPSIYIWGDSHARHLIGGFSKQYPKHSVYVLYLSSCLPASGLFGFVYDYEGRQQLTEECAQHNAQALNYFLHLKSPTHIFLSYFLRLGDSRQQEFLEANRQLIKTLEKKGHQVKIIGDIIRPAKYLIDCYQVPFIYGDDYLEQRCQGDKRLAKQLMAENEQLKKLLGSQYFINSNHVFCSSPDTCLTMVEGKPLFRDNHHLTIFGSEYLVKALAPQLSVNGDTK